MITFEQVESAAKAAGLTYTETPDVDGRTFCVVLHGIVAFGIANEGTDAQAAREGVLKALADMAVARPA